MKALEERIVREGKVLEGNVLKLGSFLNQSIDTAFCAEMATEVVSLFAGEKITKVLTVESSGIAFGFAIAEKLGVPLVFAKKTPASNQSGGVLSARIHSYTHGNDYTATVGEEYIKADDSVLIADDFLATGEALHGLIKIVELAGATLAGCAIQVEKGFQNGGDELRRAGVHVESLALIDSMSPEEGIKFRP